MRRLRHPIAILVLFAVSTSAFALPGLPGDVTLNGDADTSTRLGVGPADLAATLSWSDTLVVPNLVAADDGTASDEGADPNEGAEPFNLPRFIRETGLHRIGGYVTLGLAATTAVLGLAGVEEVHHPLGYITAGMAAGAATFGIIGYSDFLDIIWPHVVLNGLAVVGFGLNAFVWEWGSTAHIATGIGSVASMIGAWVAIQLIWN